jgi:hypothetical protein
MASIENIKKYKQELKASNKKRLKKLKGKRKLSIGQYNKKYK